MAFAGYSFLIEYTESLEVVSWKALPATVPVGTTDGPATVKDALTPTKATRYYRLVSPLN